MRAYERFLNYIQISSASDENSGMTPSTNTQFDVAREVVNDLKKIGVYEVECDNKCYVYAKIPASEGMENKEKIGFIAHMDTAPAFCGENIKPRIIDNYDGLDIQLSEDVVMKTQVFPQLLNYVGQSLVVTDGTTLLGADDKAGIAEIITAIDYILKNNIPHPAISVAFTPDEEIGEGADNFDVKKFGADYAYTVDGGALGELEYENFNAASATVTVNGNCIHPGEGKNRMVNSILIAMEYNSMLPPEQTPAHTEGYEGFYHLTDISGNEEKTVLKYIVRDHNRKAFEDRKNVMKTIEEYINKKYSDGTVQLELKDSYYNMREKIEPHMEIVDRAKEAFLQCGVEPVVTPIRGGTDGARLSFMGLPCPNLSTGGHNFHGKFEYIPIQSMDKMVEVIVAIIKA